MNKNIMVISLIVIALFLQYGNLLAQTNDNVSASIMGLPKEMKAGETVNFNVLITNKSPNTNWASDQVKTEVAGPFTVFKTFTMDITLGPGQSGEILFSVKAPADGGKNNLALAIYSDNVKLTQITQDINVTGSVTTNPDKENNNAGMNKDNSNEQNKVNIINIKNDVNKNSNGNDNTGQ